MSLITHNGLLTLLESGAIRGAQKGQVGAASIDVTLGSALFVEAPPVVSQRAVDLMRRETPEMQKIDLLQHGYFDLPPGGFCLAATAERFYLPNDVAAEVKMRSSLARAGLDHALAGWADPGWHGSVLTLELRNNLRYHSLRLRPGLRVAQMIFWHGEPVPDHASYARTGRYNGDVSVQPSKGAES